MEQKFTFKRMLSLLVVFAMLFASFAVLAVSAGAIDFYWSEGDYSIADNGNMTANNAYGYVFDIASLNAAVNETNTICTDNENWQAKVYGWSVSVVLEQVEGNVYKVVKTYNAPQLGGTPWTDHVEALADGQIVMVVHSSGSRPNAAGDYSDGAAIEYANWESKVAALALAAGTEVTLAGIDLEGLTCENGTVTVQEAPSTEPEPTPEEPEQPPVDPEQPEQPEQPSACKLGDINNDGKINQYDYILAKRIHFKNYTPTAEETARGDVNNDGKNDQYDYILIKRHHFKNYTITGNTVIK